ncbi:MAG: biopolymer transporter ExbD [Opitutales bacterium]|jgi:biopolymer transport protein ExbD|nr:biopolymer transporter ExbD [Opitutales bacterium]
MARTFHRRERLGAMSEINVTPLIDLAFALLIIFMITAPLLEQSIDINLPVETARPQTAERPRVQEISLDAEGRIFWGSDPVTPETLRENLELFSLDPSPPVISVRADADLRYQAVVDLMDLIKSYQLTRISLETRAR